MKCAECDKYLGPQDKAYSLNYQEDGTKFYGSMWCGECGKDVMKILSKPKEVGRLIKKVKEDDRGNH